MTRESAKVLQMTEMTAPCLRLDVDLAEAVPDIGPQQGIGAVSCAWILVRIHTEPIGALLIAVPQRGLSSDQIELAISEVLDDEISARRKASVGATPTFLAARQQVLVDAPKMTVVICTHERPDGLEACLKSLLVQEYPDFSILVVDNHPTSDRSKAVVDRMGSPMIEYVVEPNKGLSWARNRALEVVEDGIVAWIDDDEIADRHWLAELARGFDGHPGADGVAGVMVPGELETWAQVWFEQYGGHNKHRGFVPDVFSPASRRQQSPLYPLPPFGTGGNMAFPVGALRAMGGFDAALGAGSRCMGAEDTRAFSDLLSAGGTIVYQPTAVTHHFHRRTLEELKRQTLGYGVGLTAFYTSLVWARPQCVPELIKLLPLAWRDLFSSQSLRSGDLPVLFPNEVRRANRRGILMGPWMYLRARRDVSRLVRAAAR